MIVWIVVGIAVVAVGLWAFWPRRRGIVDGQVQSVRSRTQGDVENYDNSFGPTGPL